MELDEKLVGAVQEIKADMASAHERIRNEVQKASEEKAIELVASYKEEVGKYNVELDEKLAKIQEHVDKVDLLSQKQADGKKSQRQHFKEFLQNEIVAKEAELAKQGASNSLDFKAVGDMSSGNITTAITDEYVPGFLEPGVNRVSKRPAFIQSLVNRGSISNTRTVTWYEQTTTEGAPATRAEAAAMAQVDKDYTRVSETLRSVSAYMKVTNEALSDLSWLMSELQFELFRDLDLELDSQLLTGDGTGNNLSGIRTKATAFAAGAFATAVDAPNRFDVLRVGINQIVLGEFFPTSIVIHPNDATAMDLTKLTDGQYVLPPFTTSTGQVIKGVPVVENTGITSGDFLIMDGSRATAFYRENLSLRVWDQNENDPLHNRKTITGNVEALLRIKGNDVGAFVDGTFGTAITAITAP